MQHSDQIQQYYLLIKSLETAILVGLRLRSMVSLPLGFNTQHIYDNTTIDNCNTHLGYYIIAIGVHCPLNNSIS